MENGVKEKKKLIINQLFKKMGKKDEIHFFLECEYDKGTRAIAINSLVKFDNTSLNSGNKTEKSKSVFKEIEMS